MNEIILNENLLQPNQYITYKVIQISSYDA